MCIHHNLVVSCLLDATEIVVVEWLTVVMLTVWNDVAYISALDSVVAIVNHELVCLVEVTVVVGSRR